jgi:hypothetical protein
MLISGELYQALKEGASSDERAMAAAAVSADQEMRLRRLEEMFKWAVRATGLFGTALLVVTIVAIRLK